MVQDKTEQRTEQTVESVQEVPPVLEGLTNENDLGEEGVPQIDQKQQRMEREIDSLQALPTKQDMADMMSHLECIIKGEWNATRMDIQNVLQRVEASKAHLDVHKKAIMELRERAESDWLEMRNIRYRLKDQENWNRHNNFRILGLPESVKNSDLEKMVREVFNKILKREIASSIRFERVHRIQKITMPSTDTRHMPSTDIRDVIARFFDYEIKQQVSFGMRSAAPVECNGAKILIFTDLSQETLACRRALKPLIAQLQGKNISYRWGFPACLLAKSQGISATLQFPEDLKDFCSKLDMPLVNLENWEKRPPDWGKLKDQSWNKV